MVAANWRGCDVAAVPEGRHYSGVGGTGAAVILGGAWAGSSRGGGRQRLAVESSNARTEHR